MSTVAPPPGSRSTRFGAPASRPVRWALAVLGSCACGLVPMERFTNFGWHSDDVAWQVAFRTWRPGHGTLVLTENTYVVRLPLLVVADALTPSGWTQLAVVSLVLNAIAFLLARAFARRVLAESIGLAHTVELTWREELIAAGAALVPFVLSEATRLSNSGLTTRNLEAGVYLLAIMHAVRFSVGRATVGTRRSFAAVAVGTALLSLNDPLFAFTIAGPVLAIGGVRLGARARRGRPVAALDRQLLRFTVAVATGIVGWTAARVALGLVAIEQRGSGVTIASPGGLTHRLATLARVGSLAAGFSRRDASNLWISAFAIVTTVIAAGAAAVVGVVIVRRDAHPYAAWSLAWIAWLCLLFVTTTAGDTVAGFRYVAVGFAAPAVVAGVALARTKWGHLVVAGVALVAIVGATGEHVAEWGENTNHDLAGVATTVDRLGSEGMPFGYSGYWSAAIVTYLTSAHASVLAVQCDGSGRTAPFEWLADLDQFDRSREAARSAAGTFFVVDNTAASTACSPDLLRQQFGAPDEEIPVGDDGAFEVWVWRQPFSVGGRS